jgi:hypothetical protein
MNGCMSLLKFFSPYACLYNEWGGFFEKNVQKIAAMHEYSITIFQIHTS